MYINAHQIVVVVTCDWISGGGDGRSCRQGQCTFWRKSAIATVSQRRQLRRQKKTGPTENWTINVTLANHLSSGNLFPPCLSAIQKPSNFSTTEIGGDSDGSGHILSHFEDNSSGEGCEECL